MPFGNVNVSYTPCRSVGQLKYAANYMLGRNRDQIKNSVVKTAPNLYMALGCNRENFANNMLVTRKLNGLKQQHNDRDTANMMNTIHQRPYVGAQPPPHRRQHISHLLSSGTAWRDSLHRQICKGTGA